MNAIEQEAQELLRVMLVGALVLLIDGSDGPLHDSLSTNVAHIKGANNEP